MKLFQYIQNLKDSMGKYSLKRLALFEHNNAFSAILRSHVLVYQGFLRTSAFWKGDVWLFEMRDVFELNSCVYSE